MIAILAALVLGAGPAAGEVDAFQLPKGRVRVEANHLEVTHQRTIEASGGVTITAPGIRAHAEKVVYDRGAQTLEISGGVTMEIEANGEKAKLTADSATIDVDSHAGVLRNATVTGAGITLHGAKITRTESGRYRIDQASFTPCDCGPGGRPSWEITASRITAKPNGLGLLQGGVLRAKGVPIFFLPIGFAPLSSERASGFLSPQLSQNGNDGVIASLPFYLAMGKNWDLTVDPGFNQERGPFAGSTLRFGGEHGQGELNGVYHADRKIRSDALSFPGRPDLYSPDRWYTDDRVTEQLGDTIAAKARVELASDDRYGFDFGSTLMERSRPEYETNVAVERAGGVVGVVATSNYYQDLRVVGSAGPYNSAQTVSRIGGLDLSAGGFPIFGGPGYGLHTDLDASYDFFDNVGSPQAGLHHGGSLESEPRRQVQHARFRPRVVAPLSLADDAVRLEVFGGAVGDVSGDTLGTDARSRVAPDAGATARMEFRRTFGSATKVQHRIGPFVRWDYTHEVYGQDLTSFESPSEAPVAGSAVEAGISNRLFYRRAGERERGRSVRELFELQLFERVRPNGPKKGESVANLDLRTGPLRMDLDATLDNDTATIRTAGGRASTRGDAPEGLSVEYAYAPERQSHQGTGGAWLKLAEIFTGEHFPSKTLKTLTLEAGARFDFLTHTFPSVSGGVNYESPCGCWGFRTGAAKDADRPNLTIRFSFDLHPPTTIRRYTAAPGGR